MPWTLDTDVRYYCCGAWHPALSQQRRMSHTWQPSGQGGVVWDACAERAGGHPPPFHDHVTLVCTRAWSRAYSGLDRGQRCNAALHRPLASSCFVGEVPRLLGAGGRTRREPIGHLCPPSFCVSSLCACTFHPSYLTHAIAPRASGRRLRLT